MPKDWLRQHPEKAREMGRKGGKTMRYKRTPDYLRGYLAGWIAKKREERRRG
jgi:general stress protein YciG